MFTRKRNVIRGGVPTVAAVLVAVGAGAAITAAAPARSSGQAISFTEHPVSAHRFNLGSGHGDAVGAVDLSANKLIQGSRQIGHDGVSCTITRLSGGTADDLCTSAVVLAHGQIVLAGLVTSTRQGLGTFQLAVVGGTGRYQDARGYATVVPGESPGVTIHLTS